MLREDLSGLNLSLVSKLDIPVFIPFKGHWVFKFYEQIITNFLITNYRNCNRKTEINFDSGYCEFELAFWDKKQNFACRPLTLIVL